MASGLKVVIGMVIGSVVGERVLAMFALILITIFAPKVWTEERFAYVFATPEFFGVIIGGGSGSAWGLAKTAPAAAGWVCLISAVLIAMLGAVLAVSTDFGGWIYLNEFIRFLLSLELGIPGFWSLILVVTGVRLLKRRGRRPDAVQE
jgi:hypothetical protein